jgi:hypothetical protein
MGGRLGEEAIQGGGFRKLCTNWAGPLGGHLIRAGGSTKTGVFVAVATKWPASRREAAWRARRRGYDMARVGVPSSIRQSVHGLSRSSPWRGAGGFDRGVPAQLKADRRPPRRGRLCPGEGDRGEARTGTARLPWFLSDSRPGNRDKSRPRLQIFPCRAWLCMARLWSRCCCSLIRARKCHDSRVTSWAAKVI